MDGAAVSSADDLRVYLKRAAGEITSLRGQLAQLRDRASEPIAVVGMGCRYPGGVTSPEQLWEVIAQGRDTISGFPTDRGWDVGYDARPGVPGHSYVREGGFLHDAADFDAAFFGISPREATAMDPQQRLLLEVTWEALERAGIDPRSLKGSDTAVYAGVAGSDYAARFASQLPPPQFQGYLGEGNLTSVASGRVAYVLGLEGPAVSVDTACSSSLVALHLGVRALRSGECSLALAGGVTIMATPVTLLEFTAVRGLAADGRCKAFSERADGFGPSEGAAVLVLERLSDAHRHGHRVLAVVRGSAVNQDGASNGLTAPSGPAQQRVIRAALHDAGISAAGVDLIEAHGTGTPLGDPIEAQALLATYGQDRAGAPVWVGSVKSNIGHTQAAAGMAGIIKVIAALRHRTLPATLHADTPTSKVEWTGGSLQLLQQSHPWPDPGNPRRAAVSSFGISGTNAHVIVEEAPPAPDTETTPAPAAVPWVLSARSPSALTEQARRLKLFLDQQPHTDPVDVAAALARRTAFEYRAAIVGTDHTELNHGLTALTLGQKSSVIRSAGRGRTIFAFPGQGSQWIGMGRELHASFPSFAAAFDATAKACDDDLQRALGDVIWGDDPEVLNDTRYAQPALFVIEVALTALLKSFGVHPDIVFGHSLGEITAAHVAGALTLKDAAALVTARGRLMSNTPSGGAMVAIAAPPTEVAPLLTSGVEIAALNGPAGVVISGSKAEVAAVADTLADRGRRIKRLSVSHAFHSRLIEPALDELAQVASRISVVQPVIPIVSNVNGQLVSSDYGGDGYWVRHAREPVQFAETVATVLADDPEALFMEVGPGTTLTGLLKSASATAIPVLRAGRSEPRAVVDALAARYIAGGSVNWPSLLGDRPAPELAIPTYPFNRKRFWLESFRSGGDVRAFGAEPVDHPVLRAAMPEPAHDGVALCGRLSLETHPWLADHRVGGVTAVAGAVLVDLILTAGKWIGLPSLSELILRAALAIPDHGGVTVQVAVDGMASDGRRVTLHSKPDHSDEPWTCHAEGQLAVAKASDPDGAWSTVGADPVDLSNVYTRAEAAGYTYGPAFRGLVAAWRAEDRVLAEVEVPEAAWARSNGFSLHPAILDAALQAIGLLGIGGDPRAMLVPFAWEGIHVPQGGASRARLQIIATGDQRVSIILTEADGSPVARVEALALRAIARTALGSLPVRRLDWTEVEVGEESAAHTVLRYDQGWDGRLGSLHRDLWRAVEEIRNHLDQSASPLVVTTCGGVGTGLDRVDPAAAALRGLIRSVQRERPGEIVLVDTDASSQSETFGALVATGQDQYIIRQGCVSAARLVSLPPAVEPVAGPRLAGGTVLVTGGTGLIGAAIARHLIVRHGATRLVLISRTGGGGGDSQLRGLGAEVEAIDCDVSDRDALSRVLSAIPAEAPLRGVVHCAGVVDDAVFSGLTRHQLDSVLHPKADGAWHLHELTRGHDLEMFVLCSSLAATLGSAGQANYTAANAFLDGLAQHRRALGLPAHSVAWGLWDADAGMAAALSEELRARLTRLGVRPMEERAALDLFDAVLSGGTVHAVAADLDPRLLADSSETRLAYDAAHRRTPVAARPEVGGPDNEPDLITELSSAPEAERARRVREVVYSELAASLGYEAAVDIDPTVRFEDLGFDSLSALEFRNGLIAVTGIRMPLTIAFDYETPAELVDFVVHRLGILLDPRDVLDAKENK